MTERSHTGNRQLDRIQQSQSNDTSALGKERPVFFDVVTKAAQMEVRHKFGQIPAGITIVRASDFVQMKIHKLGRDTAVVEFDTAGVSVTLEAHYDTRIPSVFL